MQHLPKPFYVTVYKNSTEEEFLEVDERFIKYQAYPIIDIFLPSHGPAIFLVPDDQHIFRIIAHFRCLFYNHDTLIPLEDKNGS